MQRGQKKLGEILVEKGLINQQQLKEALEQQARTKEFLGAILLKKRLIEEKELQAALSQQFDIPVVSLKDKYIDWNMVREFHSSLILDYKCFPLQRDDWSVTVAITNPLDIWAIKRAEEETTGFKLKLVLVSTADMNEAIARYQQYIRADIQKRFK